VQDARTDAQPFGVVCCVEDFALNLGVSVQIFHWVSGLRTRMRANMRCLGTAMMCDMPVVDDGAAMNLGKWLGGALSADSRRPESCK
jgi:hypothetical protein